MTLIPGDKVVSIQTASGPVLVQAGAPIPGDKGVTVQTAAGSVFLPVHTLIPGDKIISLDTDIGTVCLPVVAYPHWAPPFTPVTLPPMINHATVVFPDGKIVIMVGNKVYRSDDLALTWVEYTQTYYSGAQHRATLLDDGTIVQQICDLTHSLIFTSNDYGQTWTERGSLPPWQGYTWVAFGSDGTNIYCVGGQFWNGALLNSTFKSTDKGVTWTTVSTTTPFIARYAAEIKNINTTLVLVGGIGKVSFPGYGVVNTYMRDCWTSSNGGVSWSEKTSDPSPQVYPFYGDAAYHGDVGGGQQLAVVGSTLYFLPGGGYTDPWQTRAFGYYASFDFGTSWATLQTAYPCGTAPNGSMYGHTTNVLPDGRVILIGGYYNGVISNRVNIFRP